METEIALDLGDFTLANEQLPLFIRLRDKGLKTMEHDPFDAAALRAQVDACWLRYQAAQTPESLHKAQAEAILLMTRITDTIIASIQAKSDGLRYLPSFMLDQDSICGAGYCVKTRSDMIPGDQTQRICYNINEDTLPAEHIWAPEFAHGWTPKQNWQLSAAYVLGAVDLLEYLPERNILEDIHVSLTGDFTLIEARMSPREYQRQRAQAEARSLRECVRWPTNYHRVED